MSLIPLYFVPGICKSVSDYANSDQQVFNDWRVARGRYIDGNFVRFYAGFPEKLAGWSSVAAAAVTGTPRGLFNWRDNNQVIRSAIGTHKKLYFYGAGVLTDITPRRSVSTGSVNNPISTTNGSTTVTIAHTAHGLSTNDYATLTAASAVGGVTVANTYPITVVDANTYTIVTAAATSTAGPGGGSTTFTYYRVLLGNNPFATVNGSATVTVTHSIHGAAVGDTVTIGGASAVAGLTLSGDYIIQTVSTNTYTITAASNANATTTGGGAAVNVQYDLAIGLVDTAYNNGYGVGGYGQNGYGTSGTSNIVTACRTWSFAAYGQQLLANPFGGSIYVYDPAILGATGRAYPLYGAPATCNWMWVTPERIVVALGTSTNLMLLQWSDQTNYNTWTAAPTNTANTRSIQGGTFLLAGIAIRNGVNLFWSNTAVFQLTYTGDSSIYQSPIAGQGAGLIGPLAACSLGGIAYWMGDSDFWVWDGTTRNLPSDDIRDYVFKNYNANQTAKFWAGTNRAKREIWFGYCSAASTEIDRYIIYHIDHACWSIGQLQRTCWADKDLLATPTALNAAGTYFNHETGVDNDGSAMDAYITFSPLDVSNGENVITLVSFIPDFQRFVGNVTISVNTRYYPLDSDTVYANTITAGSTTKVDLSSATGRMVGYKVESNAVSGDFRLGVMRIDVQMAGSRR